MSPEIRKMQQNVVMQEPGWGGGVLPIMPIRGGSARKGYLFQASGIKKGRDFTS